MDYYRHLFLTDGQGKEITFTLIYIISTIFAFQTLLTAYTSSTYLEQFITGEYVGLVYAAGAIGAIIITLNSTKILRVIGNSKFVLLTMSLITILLVIIGLAINSIITITAFVLFLAINPQIYFNIDIFLETIIGENEHSTGSKRGIILTVMSIASFFSPIAMSYIVGPENNLSAVYFIAAAIGLMFIAFIVARFRHFYDPPYPSIRIKEMVKSAVKNSDIRIVLYAQFLLQFFFIWAVVYFPLYLATEIGLNWDQIGKIIAVGLFAFVILEYPTGKIADLYTGEKELMAIGFFILAVSTASISFLVTSNIVTWMILIFASRVGASLIEITTESYFFKQVDGNNSNLIAFFRLTRPLAALFGTLLGSLSLYFLPFNLIFVVLGLILVTGIFATIKLNDTK